MFRSKKDNPPLTSTVIGDGIVVEEAFIKGNGSIRVDGTVFGKIEVTGDIIIGESGYIKGNISTGHVLLAGRVEGNITSSSTVHITSTGNLTGNISSSALVIDEGAIFSGKCDMLDKSKNLLVYNKEEDSKQSTFVEEKDPNLSFDK